MSDFTLRAMSEADATYLSRLNFLTDVFGDESAEPSSHFEEEYKFYVGQWTPESGGFIAWDGIIPAGGAWLNWGTDAHHGAGFVKEGIPEVAIAVESRYQGQGLASLLFDALIDLAREQGAPGICLAVDTRNESARAIYEHKGFEFAAEVPDSHYISMVKHFS
ncbi:MULTISPECIES: N-acetyltransferase [unclassified Rothia (in: high G+C Gram-positive bacteria)]|uniref:GNAT family N-acetyltransferase n=1 Tax=unclassified Rothia (in: high G+C Gram-positive bacteria) TaxID=2689056 RepID=UPI00195E67E6|nr:MULTISPECIES: N-acetyltransferase [unclassified Rothia (in: high G+C Gram-positive bacteria)]MBM7052196.1 GNAT family N-acetyltransferase [Rothia sp. ZJ1223]QRZ61364.1 GNAT family N-acetyltransferase [Rothia sp. ZJ932]